MRKARRFPVMSREDDGGACEAIESFKTNRTSRADNAANSATRTCSLSPPIRLEPEVLTYLIRLAKEKDTTLNILINQLLKKDIELIAIGA